MKPSIPLRQQALDALPAPPLQHDSGMGWPMTTLVKSQSRSYGPRAISGWDVGAMIKAEVRFDDCCENGHNTFSITGEIYIPGRHDCEACGCLHDEIAQAFPDLAPLIKWHLTSTDGPLHYLANTLYHADGHGPTEGWLSTNGTIAGEQVKGLRYGNLAELQPIADANPGVCTLKIDESTAKERRLDYARSCAVWPEATDEELLAPDLKARLEARLPALMADFQAAVESLGFTY